MTFRTGISIYNKPWLIEPQSALRMLDYWEQVKKGSANWDYRKAVSLEDDEQPVKPAFNVLEKLLAGQKVMTAPESIYQMKDFNGFDGAETVIIPVEGALMKSNYCGWFGTDALKQMFLLADQTDSVKNIILLVDSPGGTVDGTQAFADAVRSSAKNTITLVDGMMCSAAYWIGSSSKQVFASNKTDIIGSIGTMISWYDNSKAISDMGYTLREYYATESVDKNASFKEANAGNGSRLVAEMLDPMNNVFLSAIKDNRAGKIDLKQENILTGKTYLPEAAQGNGLIDGIQTLSQVIAANSKAAPSNKKPKSSMSKNNLVFQQVLNVVNAESLEVVDNGFLMTEEQLNAIDAELQAQETTIKTLSAKVGTASDTSAEQTAKDLKASQDKVKQLETDNADLKVKLQEAETRIHELEEEPGGGFAGANNKGDRTQPNEAGKGKKERAHDRALKDLLG